MIPDISQAQAWLENHPQVVKGIRRGIERETLRVNSDGSLATTSHSLKLGSALTHKWITTDFAEALLEFVTPVDGNIDHMLTLMRDIHRFTARQLGDEQMWPFSMPCYIEQGKEIKLAQYGSSNVGRMKTLYREGLKNRYGTLMQIISGLHYNFSLPIKFWKEKYGEINKETISAGYFHIIRNYYRFGWIISYLFGASPAICSSFLQGKSTSLPFEKINCDVYYLPYATSLRLSDLGYSNNAQNSLRLTFNELHEYVAELKRAIKTPLEEYEKIGLEKDGRRLQINSNILQIEDELYSLIRPKCVAQIGEVLSDALERGGIEYIEVRSLDVNPFSPIGVDEQQIRFLDLFMVWCALVDAPAMSSEDLQYTRINWNRIILEGRNPNLMLNIGCGINQFPLMEIGRDLFRDLKCVAKILDSVCGGNAYQKVCDKLVTYFDDPELTFSARILRLIIKQGINDTGCILSTQYRDILRQEPLEILSENDFIFEREASLERQKKIEETDSEPFEAFLESMIDRKGSHTSVTEYNF